MTKREFMEQVATGVVNEEIKEMAVKFIEDMDAANAKRREKMSEKAAEKEKEKAPIREAILACITDEGKTATTLIEEAGVALKPQAIPSLLKPLIEEGRVVKVDLKVKGKGTQRGYALAE